MRPAVACVAFAALLGAVPAGAQQMGARAYLDRNPVEVGQAFTVYLDVPGARGLDAEPAPPRLDAFARHLGTNRQTSMQVVNGQTSVTYQLQYRYQALVEGSFTIPGMEVRANGEFYATDPMPIEVVAARAGSRAPTGDPRNPRQAGPTVGPGDLFIVADVDRTSVFENEPIVVTYRIFTRVNVSSYTPTTASAPEGFWAEEVPAPAQGGWPVENVTRDGVRYATAIVQQVALFPTGSGSRTIGPYGIEARVRVQRRAGDIFSDFFGGNSLFGSLEPVAVATDPIDVEVRPLPSGAPADFTGFVGSLDVRSSVDRSSVDANDAVTFSVTVSGEGNLRSLPTPSIDFPEDFEVFEPDVSETVSRDGGRVRGTKTFDYVVIPRAPGDRALPTVSVAYFDPVAGRYSNTAAPEIPLAVTGDAPALPVSGVRSGVESVREDIRFIRLGTPRLTARGRNAFAGATFWILFVLPMAGVGGALLLRRHQDRLVGDIGWARGRRAGKVARKRLSEARALVGEGDGKRFYAEVARALTGFLADKLNVAEAGLMTEDARSELTRRGVEEAAAAEYFACLEHCDRQRFAPSGGGAEEYGAFLARAEAAMTALDGGLAR